MAIMQIKDVCVRGISACVPKNNLENKDYSGFNAEEAITIPAAIGIERHRIADKNTCASDLCYYSAEKLIADLGWAKEEIDVLVFVSQTPDYILPATACLLQTRLGLKEEVIAFDIPLGCSGWVYGLQVITSLLSHGFLRKGLLLVSDTTLKFCSPEDKSTFPLFGDAGTATALEYMKSAPGFRFHSATDGSGCEAIQIPDGGYRNQVTVSSLEMSEIKPGIKRNRLQVVLNGVNVLTFSISKAPESINKLSKSFNFNLSEIDYFLLHQANFFINERIRNKLKLPIEKVPYSLRNFGNTGPASIPMTMVTELRKDLVHHKRNIIACGFGVGFSWGSVQLFADKIVCPELIEL